MKWIRRMFLDRWLPSFTADDILNAEQEDFIRDHGKMLVAVQEKTAERTYGNSRLRAALNEAKLSMSSTALIDFERSLHHERRKEGVPRSHK